MKIDPLSQSITNAAQDNTTRPARKDTAAPQKDRVELSTLSNELNAVHADPRGELDMARVQEIKQAISEGRFKVDASVVADKLLEAVKDLLQNRTLQ